MLLFTSVSALRQHLSTLKPTQTIALVPTMGALHGGHIALVDQARRENDVVVCSIFVNPVQFNNPNDLARYPRTLDADQALLEPAGCNIVFAPAASEMYPEPPALTLHFGELETVMEGAMRPGHFNGVGIVVAKLLNVVQPRRAYFGQKDLQQVAVIRRLVRTLNFPVELIRFPTVREADGLALSSRNRNLTPAERQQAPALYQALTMAHDRLREGQSVSRVKAAVVDYMAARPDFRLEYVEVADADTLQPVVAVMAPGQTALCIAAHLGAVRLIDNLVF